MYRSLIMVELSFRGLMSTWETFNLFLAGRAAILVFSLDLVYLMR